MLDRCEWGKDDYSLKIASLPKAEEESEADLTPTKLKHAADPAQGALFATQPVK